MKQDYNKKMHEIIDELNGEKKTLLLHSCCAPCSSSVLERLLPHFDITVLYYNPNIMPKQEFEKRKTEEINFLNKLGVKYIDIDYLHEEYLSAVKGKELLPEKSAKCYLCYKLRIEKTAEMAKQKGFDFFCTTLTVSPHKIAEWVNKIMLEMSEKYGVKCLFSDFKKENGYLRSIQISKQENFYRQNYCGCRFN